MRRMSLVRSSALTAFGCSRARTIRALFACAALIGVAALGGCNTEGIDMAKAMKPLPAKTVALIESKGMSKSSPILIRVYKEESELEVWKKDNSGQFALLKTYPICRWSGELGPKMREGDRQAPEGFYNITPAQMNPNSQYYLSFNMGYPNAYDRAWGRTGAQLMVHGDCSSAGCYSMTDEQIAEIYALGRDAFFGGQRSFQVQAFPFRMTALNMARHRNNPNFAFWKMLKVGSDHFEATHQQPKVDVCEKRYVFDAESSQPFKNTERCPAYKVPDEITAAVTAKERQDDQAFARYVAEKVATAPIRTGRDGGMNPVFLAKYRPEFVSDRKGVLHQFAEKVEPGTISDYTPSRSPDPVVASAAPAAVASAVDVPWPRSVPGRGPTVAAAPFRSNPASAYVTPAAPRRVSADSGNVFDRLFSSGGTGHKVESGIRHATSSVVRAFGLGGEDTKPAPAAAIVPPATTEHARRRPVTAKRAPAPRPSREQTAQATSPMPPPAPAEHQPAPQQQQQQQQRAANSGLLNGSQPIIPATGFETRWQALK
jgi:murein L,D-transpeptidase YafK